MRKHTSMGLMRTTFKLTQQPSPCGESQSSEAWYWPSFHCKWSDVSVAVHCSSLILRSPWCFELSRAWFSFPRGMFSEVDVGFANSLHTICSRHVDPPELLHLADSLPMHGRNVALVAAMNSPATFWNVNYVWTKLMLNIMTAELSINKIKSDVI